MIQSSLVRNLRRALVKESFQRDEIFRRQTATFEKIEILVRAIYCFQILGAFNALRAQPFYLKLSHLSPPMLFDWFRLIPHNILSHTIHLGYISLAFLCVLGWRSRILRALLFVFAFAYQGYLFSFSNFWYAPNLAVISLLFCLVLLPQQKWNEIEADRCMRQASINAFWCAQSIFFIITSALILQLFFGGFFSKNGISILHANAWSNLAILFGKLGPFKTQIINFISHFWFFGSIVTCIFLYSSLLPIVIFRRRSYIAWGVILVIPVLISVFLLGGTFRFDFVFALLIFCSPFYIRSTHWKDSIGELPLLSLLFRKKRIS